MNCYNPGMDLLFAPVPSASNCGAKKCPKKDYDKVCMYSTQGKYVCNKQDKYADGWEYIMMQSK